MGRKERVNEVVKSHDPKLFCEHREGKLWVLRESWKWEPYEVDGQVYNFLRPNHHFVFALTDNWKITGSPVEWGLLPIQNRLKAIDLWNRDLASEIIDQTEKETESLNRDRRNSTENFLYEFRDTFKKTFKDVNTSSLAKKDLRKIKEKSHGNR